MGVITILLTTLITLAASQFSLQDQFTLTQPFNNAKEKFDVFGSATLYSDTIVLTPNSPHVGGAIWSKKTNTHIYWQAEFSFRVSGAERGGKGLAFWYAAKPGRSGNVFGNADQWDGLGLFFDPNSGGKSTLRGHLNAGTERYETLTEPLTHAFASCPLSFRTFSAEPIFVKITNSASSFKVTIDDTVCFETNQVVLQPGNYFGISAATGDVPDQHQIFGFKLLSLPETEEPKTVDEAEADQPQVIAQHGAVVSRDRNSEDLKSKFAELQKQFQEYQDQNTLILRRIEGTLATISRSLGSLSTSLSQLHAEVTKGHGAASGIDASVRKLTNELGRLETVLKDHMSGHVGVLSESLVNRGGFWKGILIVVSVQAAGWVVYEVYRKKRDMPKKLL